MRSLVVATALAAVGLCATGCGITAEDLPVPGGGTGGDTYELKAVFTDALNLPSKAKVKLDGVSIGRVEDLEVDGYNAEVTMAILEEYELPVGSTFKLRQTSALGEVYVSVTAPADDDDRAVWHDGDVVGVEHTGQAPGIEDSLAALSLLTNGGGVSQLTTIVRESAQALGGGGTDVRAVLSGLETVLATLDRRTDEIVTILDTSASITDTVHRRGRVIDTALREVPRAVSVLAHQTDQLMDLLGSVRELSAVGARTVTTVRDEVLHLLRTVNPTLDGYIALDDHLGGVLADMMDFYRDLRRDLPGEAAVGTLSLKGLLLDGGGGGHDIPGDPDLPPITLPDLPDLQLPDLGDPDLADLLGLGGLLGDRRQGGAS